MFFVIIYFPVYSFKTRIVACPQVTQARNLEVGDRRFSSIDNSMEDAKLVNVYPNPTTGLVNISVPNGVIVSKIEIFNNAGKEINMSSYVLESNIIDLSSHPSGMYMIRIYTDQGMFDSKVILK